MEINVEIKNLTKEDIIYILSEGFKYPIWNKNNVLEITNQLLDNEYTTIISSKNIRFSISLHRLYKGIELFIKNGGSIDPLIYGVNGGNKIIQYTLFGEIIY